MKDKILVVYTGGTICSFLGDFSRELDVERAKSVIIHNFEKGDSEYASLAGELFEDSMLSISTLSENMTTLKQNCIIDNIGSYDLSKYKGVIVLHGTDTLAYTASLLSMVFSDSPVPIMMVSANRPPNDPMSNANANFKAATELIMNGIAPNVYAPYRNSDGVVYIHIASTLMQCANFSEDFYNDSKAHVFSVQSTDYEYLKRLSEARSTISLLSPIKGDEILLIHPYAGLDYSRIDLAGIKAVVHGTYHSGTVCVERGKEDECYGVNSILYLSDECKSLGIPIFMAPCVLDSDQYSSVYDAVQNGGIVPLCMTIESAYTKAMLGVSCGYSGDDLKKFMMTDITVEIIE